MIRNSSRFKANTKLALPSFDDLHHLHVLHTVELRQLSPLVENSSISVNYILFKKFYFFQKRDYLRKGHDYYLKLYFLNFVTIIYIMLYYSKHFLQRFQSSSPSFYTNQYLRCRLEQVGRRYRLVLPCENHIKRPRFGYFNIIWRINFRKRCSLVNTILTPVSNSSNFCRNRI